MNHSYYIGIDIDDINAVISYYRPELKEPETLSTVAGSEIFQIPLLLAKKRGIGQWFIGEEAGRMALLAKEEPLDRLLTRALEREKIRVEDEVYDAETLLALYLKKMILLASRLGNPKLPDLLVITMEQLSREKSELFDEIAKQLGIERNRLMLLDRKESFYYFVYNQNKALWLHDVCLFDYRTDEITCCIAQRNIKTIPQTIVMTEKICKIDGNNRDDGFYKLLNECFSGRTCSSVYLVGDGFEGDWMKTSLAYMCRGRRAFIGKNLYSKGACYAALVKDKYIPWPYVYMGDNEMKINVSLKVNDGGKLAFYTLISAGENWYDAYGECEVILDDGREIGFWIQFPESRDAKIEKLELSDLPERVPKTTRLRISAKPISDTKVKIVMKDLGFGEIAKSSEQSWEYTMSL